MRIGLITADFAPNVGGVAAHVVELGKALAAAGHEVHVITLPMGDTREKSVAWQGMTVHRPAIPRLKPLYSWFLHVWLGRFLRRVPLDVLHVHGLRPLEATRKMNIPVLFTNHTSGYLRRIEKGPSEKRKMAQRLVHISHVLAPSEELCAATRAVGYTGPVDFIPNGVDIRRFTPGSSPRRQAWNIGSDEVVILLARRLVDKNGVNVFAESARALAELPVRLVFAGDGPERGKVVTTLKSIGMFNHAIFLGNVPNIDMPDVYRAADISVLPSFFEATSITGLESMACGLCLVGTRVGGIPVLIDDGVTGILVPPGDPAALGAALRQLVCDPARRRNMGEKARTRAVDRFSWKHIAAETVHIYSRYSRTSV